MSASIDRYSVYKCYRKEQVLPDMTEIDMKVDLKIRGYKNDMGTMFHWTYKRNQPTSQ